MFSGEVIEPAGHADHVVPLLSEYSLFSNGEPPLFPRVKLTEIAASLAVNEFKIGALGTTELISNDRVTSAAAL